eukprot:g6770.t1
MNRKNSILRRPKPRQPSRRNETTFEKEFQKEQQKLEARRQRRLKLEQSCLGRLNRDPNALEDARQESVRIFEQHMARVQRDQAELQKQDNAKDLEIQQVLRDRYEAEQAKIENRRQESNAVLKLNQHLAESKTQKEKLQRQEEQTADMANFNNHFNLRFGTSLT